MFDIGLWHLKSTYVDNMFGPIDADTVCTQAGISIGKIDGETLSD